MKAVVYQGPRSVSIEDRTDPASRAPGDAVARLTTTDTLVVDLQPGRAA